MFKLGKTEWFILGLILISSVFLRFSQLGYSHFYGDETKTIYINKALPAGQFLLDQRKGPLQFVVVWVVEKALGSVNELSVRVPFTIASVLSVVIFYILVRKLFNWQTAIISTLLFSLNGLFIAFSRIAQYQSFLILLGLLSVYLFILAVEKSKKLFFILSALVLSGAFYFHYDAVFYLVPILYLLYVYKKENIITVKNFVTYFVFPLIIALCAFFIPYILKGYFEENTIGYIARRLVGKDYLPNNSLYTLYVYNPSWLFFIPLLAAFLALLRPMNYRREMLLLWFLVPFITFQFIVLNPGTHIQNYLIPLFILSGYIFYEVYTVVAGKSLRYFYVTGISLYFLTIFYLLSGVYVPFLNNGYPWKGSNAIQKNYNLFLYGFPYYRGWDQAAEYLKSVEGVRGVYTNDNDTMAQYYLRGYNYTPPGSNFIPHYYLRVMNNQEFRPTIPEFEPYIEGYYTLVKTIEVEGEKTIEIFKRTKSL